jgi:F-type H+-transporting ATPase subunit gamma
VATLRDIQRRIRSVEKTQQITSAMRMVAAAKLRRAQDAIIAARPYSDRMYAMLQEIGRREPDDAHPLLERREDARTLEVVVITSDRGLCGAFNANLIKHAESVIRREAPGFQNLVVTPVGRKAVEYFRKHRAGSLGRAWSDLGTIDVKDAIEMAADVMDRFVAGKTDQVLVVFSRFESALVQRPVEIPLLPLALMEGAGETVDGDTMPYEVEPSAREVLGALLPRAIEFSVYRALLENQAGEHAARMTSMESATRNTEELIRTLTLQFNRARQAAITKELVEIVTGAQALE